MKPYDELTIKDDFMFCMVMQDKDLCIECLERILGRKIRDITYYSDQKQLYYSYDSKSIRLDVFIEGDDSVYDIEMQSTNKSNLARRTRYYQSMIDMNLLEKGKDYSSLKNSIIIFICPFDPFGKNHLIYDFIFKDKYDSSLSLEDGQERIFLNTQGSSGSVDNKLKTFLDYIDSGMVKDKYTKAIDDRIIELKKRSEGRHEYMTWEMKMEEYAAEVAEEARATAHKEGLAQGLAEGRTQGLAEGRTQGLAEGRTQGLAEGRTQGLAEGRTQGLTEGKAEIIKQLIKDGIISTEDAINKYHISSDLL